MHTYAFFEMVVREFHCISFVMPETQGCVFRANEFGLFESFWGPFIQQCHAAVSYGDF